MTRKQFLLLGIAVTPVLAQPPIVHGTKEEIDFEQKFNLWATIGNRNGEIVDAKEIRAWHAAEKAWNRLRTLARQSYK